MIDQKGPHVKDKTNTFRAKETFSSNKNQSRISHDNINKITYNNPLNNFLNYYFELLII